MDLEKMHRIENLQHLSNSWDICGSWRLHQESGRGTSINNATDHLGPRGLRITIELPTPKRGTATRTSIPAETSGTLGTCPKSYEPAR